MAKKYYITYWTDKTIVDPISSDVFYKVKSVTEVNSEKSSGIELSKNQYNKWVEGLTAYHYINDTHYRIEDAFVDVEEKNKREGDALERRKESDVFTIWEQYKNYDAVGNLRLSNELKAEAQGKATLLGVNEQKAFIVAQLAYLRVKIDVLTGLGEDVTDLELEYDKLELDYNTLGTT